MWSIYRTCFSIIIPWEYYFVLQRKHDTKYSCIPMNVTIEFIAIHAEIHSEPYVPKGVWNMADIRVWIIEIWLAEPRGGFYLPKMIIKHECLKWITDITLGKMPYGLEMCTGDFILDLSFLPFYKNTTNYITHAPTVPIPISKACDGKALQSLIRYSCAICFINGLES